MSEIVIADEKEIKCPNCGIEGESVGVRGYRGNIEKVAECQSPLENCKVTHYHIEQ